MIQKPVLGRKHLGGADAELCCGKHLQSLENAADDVGRKKSQRWLRGGGRSVDGGPIPRRPSAAQHRPQLGLAYGTGLYWKVTADVSRRQGDWQKCQGRADGMQKEGAWTNIKASKTGRKSGTVLPSRKVTAPPLVHGGF